MATTERMQRQLAHTEVPEPVHERERFYFDDALDADPPLHLLRGPSTPEEIAAARAKARERGLVPRRAAQDETAGEGDRRTASDATLRVDR